MKTRNKCRQNNSVGNNKIYLAGFLSKRTLLHKQHFLTQISKGDVMLSAMNICITTEDDFLPVFKKNNMSASLVLSISEACLPIIQARFEIERLKDSDTALCALAIALRFISLQIFGSELKIKKYFDALYVRAKEIEAGNEN